MGLQRIRVDSVAELRKKKSVAQIQKENEKLLSQVASLEGQLIDTQLALCDVYEMMTGGAE